MPDLSEVFQALPLVLLLVIFGVGVAGLTFGGDWLCRGAVGLAAGLKIKPVIIGLTVVSAATSMPEFFTSLLSALKNTPGLAIGNVVGSNIANIGLILGISSVIFPLAIRLRLIRFDVPIMIGVSLIFAALCWNSLSRIDGILLLGILVVYLVFLVRQSGQAGLEKEEIEKEIEEQVHERPLGRSLLWVLLGSVGLLIGADLLVRSAVEMAGRLGVNDVLVGLTIVAIGTSLPELATSVAAAVHKHADICAGNIVGSNLMNLILVSGLVAFIRPIEVERNLFMLEFPYMIFFALLLWPFFFTGKVLSRKEGVALLIFYVAFLALTTIFQVGG